MADEDVLLVDTSIAVPLVVSDHEQHQTTVEALAGLRLGLAGHAAYETFSVLTRLPAPLRRHPRVVALLIQRDFPETRFLSAQRSRAFFETIGALGIAGGAVYDGLVGSAAAEHGLRVASRDRRALDVYRLVGAQVAPL